MKKVFFHTFWCMSGVEAGAPSAILARSWLTAIDPPYYRGVGLALRFGRWSVRFGICYPRMPVTADPDDPLFDDAHQDAVGGRALDTKEFYAWHSSPDFNQTRTLSSGDDSDASPLSTDSII